MPICHGSGGLAGQYRFGARSGASVIILGIVKLVLGLFVGDGIVPLLQKFPKGGLGVMVFAAGVELARVGEVVERGEEWMVMLVTVAGCLAFKNDAVGFFAGLAWFWGLWVARVVEERGWVGGGRGIRLDEREEEEERLLERGFDA
jgi:MFS superfamily sulfate permease-like transporter